MTNPATNHVDLTAEVAFLPADSAETLSPGEEGSARVRRFEGVAYTGAVVERGYGRLVIDVAGIEQRDVVPMLVDHEAGRIAGYADKVTKGERGDLRVAGRLSCVTEEGQLVAGLSDEGFPWQMSVGLLVTEREEFGPDEVCMVNGEEIPGPVSCARRSKLREVSFLYAGADDKTTAVALSSTTTDTEAAGMTEVNLTEARGEVLRQICEQLESFEDADKGFAAIRFAEGKTVPEIRLELAERGLEELAATKTKLAAVEAERDELKEQLAALADLESAAGEPGLGFNGAAREAGKPEALATKTPETYDEAWEQSEKLRAEFNQDRSRFDAYVRARRPKIKELL